MKNITVNILAIIASTIIFTFNTASAAEWVHVIEMGESGITVEFPMTPAEITAEKTKRDNLAANRRPDGAVSKKNLKIFKMGDPLRQDSCPDSIVFPKTLIKGCNLKVCSPSKRH